MQTIPRVTFDQHFASLNWAQGEHVLIIAPTGSGKTTLANMLMPKRTGHVLMPITKVEDKTLTGGAFKDYRIIREWNRRRGLPLNADKRVMVWPTRAKGMSAKAYIAHQREVFARMLDDVMDRGHRTVLIDEMHMMSDPAFIGLKSEIALLLHQGRSAGVTMVMLSQRPAWIPVIAYSSASHVYIANTGDMDDLKRLLALGRGMDKKTLAQTVATLPSRHDFLYLNPTGDTPPQIVNVRS